MGWYILIYYAIGLVTPIIGGVYVEFYYGDKLSNEEINGAMKLTTNEYGLVEFMESRGLFVKAIVHIMSIAILPIIAFLMMISWVNNCDRLVAEKKEEA